jgi:enoyl reductase-like protein
LVGRGYRGVAAKHSKVKDEPIEDLLGNINSSLVDKLVERVSGGDKSKIPMIDYLGPKLEALPQLTS